MSESSTDSDASFVSAKSQEEQPAQSLASGRPPRFPPNGTGPSPRSSSRAASPHLNHTGAGEKTVSFSQFASVVDDGDNDWGSFEFSDIEIPIRNQSRPDIQNDIPDVIPHGDSPRETLRLGGEASSHGDSITGSALKQPLIGIYADPAARKDDWADDFDLEAPDLVHAEASFPSPFMEPLHEPQWPSTRDSPIISSHVFNRLNVPRLDLNSGGHPLPASAASEYAFSSDDGKAYNTFPNTPLTAAPAGPRVQEPLGYDSPEVHQSCAHLKEVFARHSASVQQHVDGVIAELGNLVSVDQEALAVLLYSSDSDIAKLADVHKDAASDILEWKLELAGLTEDRVGIAKAMLGLAQYCSSSGNVEKSQEWLDKVLKAVDFFEESSFAVSLRIEADYERAVNERRLRKLDRAREVLNRAMSKCAKLINMRGASAEQIAPSLRGVWWSLRCKFLLAEICRDQNLLSNAIQLYSEFSVECIGRMLGLVAPVDPENANVIALPWYYLFSPRSLVTAIWSCTRCLFDLHALSPAADMALVAMNAATLFGNKDVNDGAAELRANAKSALREYKRQHAPEPNASPSPGTALDFGSRHPASQYDVLESFTRNDDEYASVESEEDWDQIIAQEMNIKIERCSNANILRDGVTTPIDPGTPFGSTIHQVEENSFISSAGNTFYNTSVAKSLTAGHSGAHRSTSTDLMESELRLYLNRLHSAASALSVHQLYPKPTVPFDGVMRGVKEHESFLRNFVRGKDPKFERIRRSGQLFDSVWDPTFIDARHREDPMAVFRAKSTEIDRFSSHWATLVLETVWNILRGDDLLEEKRATIRTLLQNTINDASQLTARSPLPHERVRRQRMDMLAVLLEALKLSREILLTDGSDATWFSRACTLLGTMASTIKPAVKAAVELFQAESRAHCGVRTVIPSALINHRSEQVANPKSEVVPVLAGTSASAIGMSLQQSVVDILHALFWRTKSGFDASSSNNSFERLIHADVASTLFLTGCGFSPVDGSRIDVVKDESILAIHDRTNSNQVIDETRRVSSSELIQELQNLWASLPSSAAVVRAKVSFALAIHSEIEPHDYGRTEQFLFDGLQALHSVSASAQNSPESFFSTLSRVSPIAVVSTPLSEAMLLAYGKLTLNHSKYRYGIAALEAASDCRRVRDLRNTCSMATAMDVANAALSKGDWRRALVLLYDLRGVVHPKDGKRDDFVHLCLLLHQICFDVGCFSAAVVPLRAFSALIYEERLRVLLLPNRRRLARKSKNRQKFHSAISPLPTRHTKSPYLKAESSSLAVLFESPGNGMPPTEQDLMDSSASSPILPVDTNVKDPVPSASVHRRSKTVRFSRNVSLRSSKRTASADVGSPNLESTAVAPASKEKKKASSSKSRSDASSSKKRPRSKPHSFEEEQKELVRIEAEQESIADTERFKVEFLLIKTAFSEGRYGDANSRCQGLLEMKMPISSRFKVCEVRVRIALKRRAITKCLELIDDMEREYRSSFAGRQRAESGGDLPRNDSNQRRLSGTDDSARTMTGEGAPIFIASITFLRLSALLHGGRLSEGLMVADDALKQCPESELWNNARLHYLRGKILYAISSISTAPFDGESGMARSSASLDVHHITLTLSAFETASKYYEAAGDEIGMLKSDLLWARTCIDTLFRRVVLPYEAGGGIPLDTACSLGGRTISPAEVEEAIHHVLHLASTANLPILLIDALAALAEIKCIRGDPVHLWTAWVAQSWRLFSRFFTNPEDFTVLLTELAPVSTLIRLRDLCGRLVRLVLCGPKVENVAAINRHIHMFEAYVTLQLDIDRRMNLTSATRKKTPESTPNTATESESSEVNPGDADGGSVENSIQNATSGKASPVRSETSIDRTSGMHERLAAVKRHYGLERHPESVGTRSRTSRDSIRTESTYRPAGAFLHTLGTEGAALGRLGLSVFINRPRKHVFSAVIETGAVLIPSNFFTNSKVQEKAGAHVLGKDAELIFPFSEKVGLGAMQILDGPLKKRVVEGMTSNIDTDHSTSSDVRTDAGRDSHAQQSAMAKKRSNRSSDGSRRGSKRRGGSSSQVYPDDDQNDPNHMANANYPKSNDNAVHDSVMNLAKSELLELVETVRTAENNGGGPLPPEAFGSTTAERVWAHLHRIKTETKRYVHGVMSIEELGNRNGEAVRSWLHCCPNSKKEWTVPESIAKRLVYVLFAHGVIGYYVVDAGGCVHCVAFGGKQPRNNGQAQNGMTASGSVPRPLTDTERIYLYNLVKDWKRVSVWHKDRDANIINGLGVSVLRTPRQLLPTNPHSHKKSRPIVLVADTTLQVLPWELFFDHVVIRSLCLIDMIRGVQDDSPPIPQPITAPNFHSNRAIIRFVCFSSSRREGADNEKTEEARRQHFAFQSLLRLNHLCAPALNSRLGLGRFSDPTAMNAVARPTGPLSTPLSQMRKTGKLLGVRIESLLGQRNYPHVDFMKIPGLGTASTADLTEALTSFLSRAKERDGELVKHIEDYITVFLFTYADLIGSSQSVFGMMRSVRRSMLMFTPATQMKVLARHLEDVQLTHELDRVFRGARPDVCACARILVEYVSRFSRDKRIPIVVFLGEGLVDVFPRKRLGYRNPSRVPMPAADALFQRPSRVPNSPFR